MPERFGNAEHRHILAIGDARKAVPQPVEGDRRETLHGDELRNALAQNVRLIRLSRLVDGDVALGVIFRVLLPPPFPVAIQSFEQRSQSSTKTSLGALMPPSSCARRYSAMTYSACSIMG